MKVVFRRREVFRGEKGFHEVFRGKKGFHGGARRYGGSWRRGWGIVKEVNNWPSFL